MAWHSGKPADSDFLSASVQHIRENFAELEPLQPHVAELVDLTALHPHVAELVDLTALHPHVAELVDLTALHPHVAELVDLTALHPHVAALLNSRIVDHNLDVPNPPNGWYVRWENGLQVVFGEATLGAVSLSAEGSVYASPDLAVTVPAVFSTGEFAWHVNSDLGLGNVWVGIGSQAQTQAGLIRFRLYGGTAWSSSDVRVSFFAIGRWS